jgi:hypothetical protein
MFRLRLSRHAVIKARQRFRWDCSKTKAYFRQRFKMSDIPQGGRQVLDDGGVVWVVANDGYTVTIITLHLR